jgi:4-diphosphocytidyl-2C-methyl-D-erythritol kinase
VRALARAKVNLYLEVVGRRADGYHDLRTLFQTVRWGDDVVVERTDAVQVTCVTRGADVPDDDRNLAVRAARGWLAATGAARGVSIALDKRVPVGGGLGGGSSDAATVLTGQVYARVAERVRRAPSAGLEAAVAARASGDPARLRDAHHNDLAEAAIRAYPELLRFTSQVERALGRPPCLSGSGSTLFDVPDAGEADDVVARLAHLPGRREVVVTG